MMTAAEALKKIKELGLDPPFREVDGEVRDARDADVALPFFDTFSSGAEAKLAGLIALALNRLVRDAHVETAIRSDI